MHCLRARRSSNRLTCSIRDLRPQGICLFLTVFQSIALALYFLNVNIELYLSASDGFSNAQITKIDQSIIELSYLKNIKILCNFVL